MRTHRSAWNKAASRPDAPAGPKDTWSLRIRLQLARKLRDLALFNLALDPAPRMQSDRASRPRRLSRRHRRFSRDRMQFKTQEPVQFEITEAARESLEPGWYTRSCGPSNTCFAVATVRATSEQAEI